MKYLAIAIAAGSLADSDNTRRAQRVADGACGFVVPEPAE